MTGRSCIRYVMWFTAGGGSERHVAFMETRVALRASDEATRLAMVRAFESAPPTWKILLWRPHETFDVSVTDSREDESAIYFNPADPTSAIAEVTRLLSDSRQRVTVVTGARRGCGVTSVALHLCGALASTRGTCLLDLDPESSLRARLALPNDARHWGDVADGLLSAALPLAGGFRILLPPPDRRGDAVEVLRAAALCFDHLVVDAPASPWRAPALAASTAAVLVVPPSPQGVVHGREVLARYPDVSWSVVVNRLGKGGGLEARHIARRIGRPVALELPCSPYLRDREDEHRLLTERWSRLFRRVTRLAGALA